MPQQIVLAVCENFSNLTTTKTRAGCVGSVQQHLAIAGGVGQGGPSCCSHLDERREGHDCTSNQSTPPCDRLQVFSLVILRNAAAESSRQAGGAVCWRWWLALLSAP